MSAASGSRCRNLQADSLGLYKHEEAEKQAELDPNFGYFGRTRTGSDGRYRFRTIVPKSYKFAGILRAAHIHARAAHPDHGELITEMYFAGPKHDALRKQDRVFRGRSDDRTKLIIAPQSASAAPRYQFDLALS